MRIEHVAIWTHHLKRLKQFYETYFQAKAGEKYVNEARRFESCFLTFDTGARLELMQMPTIPPTKNDAMNQFTGLVHFAISVGSKQRVDWLTQQLQDDGYHIIEHPRHTGDGYYESVVLDPDGNRIEITV